MISLPAQEILRRLKSQDIQIGLVYGRSVTNDAIYDVMPLFSECYVLLASDRVSLPRRLGWAEVADLPLCLLSRDMQNRQTLDDCFKKVNALPNIVLESNAISVLIREAKSQRSFTIIPSRAIPLQDEGGGLCAHSITPERVEDVCLVRLKSEKQPKLTDAVWKIASKLDFEVLFNEWYLKSV